MNLLEDIRRSRGSEDVPFLVDGEHSYRFADIEQASSAGLEEVRRGDVVALVGDFDPDNIKLMLQLIDRGAIYTPLTAATRADHEYYFDAAKVDIVIENGIARRLRERQDAHPMLEEVRASGASGLILFSSGTTGRPKAILHNFETFLRKFRTPRPALRTLNFLLFDHIGGINTLLHTLYNSGVTVIPSNRSPTGVIADIRHNEVELLPTTPTFLRMLLLSGALEDGVPPSLKVVTYGTERMDQNTLDRLCEIAPDVDFRQTFGMSELGILRVKSRARDSLWMKIGGEGVETKVVDGILKIRSANRMIGYLNAPSPFDEEGWYDTKDRVDVDGEYIKVVGRASDLINVGGLKVLPSEIERAALEHPDILLASAKGKPNPITGQHIELTCQVREGADLDRKALKAFLADRLPEHARPHRIVFDSVGVNHRFKRMG